MDSSKQIHQLTDHLFRREAGKMVAVLTKIFGTEHLELCEDVVQDTLLHALQVWVDKGIPDQPAAWLFRVAKNKAIDIIRRNKHAVSFDFSDNEHVLLNSGYSMAAAMDEFWQEGSMRDDMLRMMFACCDPGISEDHQVTIILKTLCGFSTAEIAKAFVTTEDTISKRLYRTKEFFREQRLKPVFPPPAALSARIDAVLNVIYLLFNEGYNSTHAAELIRRDLLEEAMMLCKLLTEHPQTQLPSVYALMALMCFHASRTDSRLTATGQIILLPDQDRRKWDQELIQQGNAYLNQAAGGVHLNRYHLEAAIAYEHCVADSYAHTDWQQLLIYYDLLYTLYPSPITMLNKAVIILELYGAATALQALAVADVDKKLSSFYLYNSLLGELHARLGHVPEARNYFQRAIRQTKAEAERALLRQKLAQLS